MNETVKVVNGHRIERLVGTRKCYWVELKSGKNWCQRVHFQTIKAATEYILKSL